MNGRTQHDVNGLILPMKRLLAAAAAVCLLATLADWAVGLPARAAPAPARTSPRPVTAIVPDWLSPAAAREPVAGSLARSSSTAGTARSSRDRAEELDAASRRRLSEAPVDPLAQVRPAATPEPASSTGIGGCSNRVRFLADVTVPDGTAFGPSERFVKTWRVHNAGSCDWAGYRVVFVGGEPMGGLDQPIPDTPAGQEVEISVELTSPDGPGDYKSYWQVQSPDGANLGTLTYVIAVDDGDGEPAPEKPREAPTPIPAPAPPSDVNEGRWIDVDLSQQSLTAYEGSTPVHTTLVSTGLLGTPTPVGQFRIWIKFRTDDMAGPGYYIEDVPYVMYFYKGYGLHGVTWHGNFGQPMSHGCVNLPTEEAEWLFNWADVGTLVNIHD